MSISRLTGQDAKNVSTTTSVAIAYPGATTAGNLLIASVMANVAKANVDISGWNAIEGDLSSTAQTVAIYWKIADGTETTITATGTSATVMKLHIYEYTGNDASPLDQSNTSTSNVTSVTSLASASLSTTQADELLFVAFATAGNTTAHSVNSSFNLRQTDAANIRLFDADRIVASTGTYSTTGSWTTSVRGASAFATFKAAGGTSVTVNPSSQSATFSLQAPTVTPKRNISLAPAVQTATFSIQAPAVIIRATPSPGVLTATFTPQAPVVSTTRFVTVSPNALSATFSPLAPTITANRQVTVSPAAQDFTVSIPTPTVTAIRNISFAAAVLGASFSIQSPTVTAQRNVTVSPSAVSATFNLLAPEVIVPVNVTVNPNELGATFGLQAPSVSTEQSVTPTPNALSATFTALAPVITTYRSVTVTPSVLSMVISVVSPIVIIPELRALDKGFNGFRDLRGIKPDAFLGKVGAPLNGVFSSTSEPQGFIRSFDKPTGIVLSSKDKPRNA